jgi:aryl-alcohol dehydrogenase-like predicted oxidoreductase
MEKRRIGSLEVSVVGLGCNNFGWRIDAKTAARVVDAAIDSGINFFDTANIYGGGQSEEFLGSALRDRRDDVVIATKFGMKMPDGSTGAKPDYIRQAVEESLRRLRTDHIDLYQIHEPDPSTPIADTLGALDELVKAGKVREIGCSNFSGDQLGAAVAAVRPSGARIASVQNQYSLVHREPEREILPECERNGIAFIPYFPLANGLLSGKYRKGQQPPFGSRAQTGFGPKVFTEENLDIVERLNQFAESQGHTILELAFSWLAAKNVIASVIAGASSPEQVKANAVAVNWKLTPAELAKIDRILTSC